MKKQKQRNKYVGDCSVKGYVKKFKELKPMTDISHTISTGNRKIDKTIAKLGGATLNLCVQDPRAKAFINMAGKVYPYVEDAAANIARAQMSYQEVCRKKK